MLNTMVKISKTDGIWSTYLINIIIIVRLTLKNPKLLLSVINIKVSFYFDLPRVNSAFIVLRTGVNFSMSYNVKEGYITP